MGDVLEDGRVGEDGVARRWRRRRGSRGRGSRRDGGNGVLWAAARTGMHADAGVEEDDGARLVDGGAGAAVLRWRRARGLRGR